MILQFFCMLYVLPRNFHVRCSNRPSEAKVRHYKTNFSVYLTKLNKAFLKNLRGTWLNGRARRTFLTKGWWAPSSSPLRGRMLILRRVSTCGMSWFDSSRLQKLFSPVKHAIYSFLLSLKCKFLVNVWAQDRCRGSHEVFDSILGGKLTTYYESKDWLRTQNISNLTYYSYR